MHVHAHARSWNAHAHGDTWQERPARKSRTQQRRTAAKAAAAGSSSTEQCPGIIPCQNFSADVIDTLTAKVNKVADVGFVYFVGLATVDVHVVA